MIDLWQVDKINMKKIMKKYNPRDVVYGNMYFEDREEIRRLAEEQDRTNQSIIHQLLTNNKNYENNSRGV